MEIVWCAALAAALIVGAVGARWWPWRSVTRRRVVVALQSGDAVQGVLLRRSGPLLVLSGASVQSPQGPIPVDGTMVVERSQVIWMQVVA